MAQWQVLSTDLNGLTRSFVQDYDSIDITPTLNGYRELELAVDPLDDSAPELLIAERAIKVYDPAGALQFNGQIWEPLERSSGGIKVVARGPYAMFSWRRVRASTTYSLTNNAGGPWDAGQILADRIAVQNGYRNTYLGMGTRQASANRVRTYDPGLLEADLVAELVGAANGFFFLEQPVDNTPGVMARVNVTFPAAGAAHDDVRFEYGVGTIDNCTDYTLTTTLPRTRQVVSSSTGAGTGRIAAAAEDAGAIAQFGLFEDEETFSDVTDLTLLTAQAQGDLQTTPPTTIAMTAGLEAPLLFTDFNVGDFVRVKIIHGAFSFYDWARVSSATLHVDSSGVASTSSITLELLTAGAPLGNPELAYYRQQNEIRRRLEALERYAQLLNAANVAPPAPPAPSGSSGSGTATPPPPAPAPPPPPPPAPPKAPTIVSFIASGQWDATGTPYASATFDVKANGVATSVWLEVVGVGLTPVQAIGTGERSGQLTLSGLASNTVYTVKLHAKNSGGETVQTTTITTPRLRQF